MKDPASELAEALRERFAIVADEASRREPVKHIDRLRTISERIELLQQRLPSPVHPQLAHFLQRGSYAKALEFLETSAER